MPMTVEQFAVPFHRLVLAYDRFAFVKDDDQQLLTEDWYESFKHYHPPVWARAVDEWKATHPKFPAQSEMHAFLQDRIIPPYLREAYEAQRQERLAAAPPADPARLEEVREKFRRLKESMLLHPPGPGFHPRLEDYDER